MTKAKQSKGEERKESGGIADTIKKVVSIGVGAAFMTEDAVKAILTDLPLPKDIVSGLVQNAKSTKEDFVERVGDEVKSHLDKVDLKKLLEEVLDDYEIEISAKLNFKKKDGSKSAN